MREPIVVVIALYLLWKREARAWAATQTKPGSGSGVDVVIL
jgi:hypothetical protein